MVTEQGLGHINLFKRKHLNMSTIYKTFCLRIHRTYTCIHQSPDFCPDYCKQMPTHRLSKKSRSTGSTEFYSSANASSSSEEVSGTRLTRVKQNSTTTSGLST